MSDAIDRLVNAVGNPELVGKSPTGGEPTAVIRAPASSSLEIVARCQTCGWSWVPGTPITLERGRSQAKRHARQHGRSHRGHVTEYSARVVSTSARGSRITMLDVEITRE